MEGEYAQDPDDETSVSTVQQIRIADFINNVVAQRRSQYMPLSLSVFFGWTNHVSSSLPLSVTII